MEMPPCLRVLCTARNELVGDVSTTPEVHLIGRLALERTVRHRLVVLRHVERDELPDHRQVVERVQVQPLVLEDAPPRFDQRVREGDVDLCEDASLSAVVPSTRTRRRMDFYWAELGGLRAF